MNDTIPLLIEAISNYNLIHLKYVNGIGAVSERPIEPMSVYFEQNEWLMVAFCRLRNAHRIFKLERIKSLEILTESFAPNQFNLKDFFKNQS